MILWLLINYCAKSQNSGRNNLNLDGLVILAKVFVLLSPYNPTNMGEGTPYLWVVATKKIWQVPRALPDFSTSVVEFLCAIAFSIQKLFLVLPARLSKDFHRYL
jgi:hypothetical protein